MGHYTDPKKAGCLLEANACSVLIKELDRLVDKFQRKINKEAEKRHRDLEAALEYTSVHELQDAYGYEMITEQQYHLYLDILEQGEAALENHTPTCAERVCQMLCIIRRDVACEQREWEFSALSPEEQANELKRAKAAQAEWKDWLQEIRSRRYVYKEREEAV